MLVAPFRASVVAIPDEHRLKFQAVLDLYRRIKDGDKPSAVVAPTEQPVRDSVAEVLKLVAQVHRSSDVGASGGRRELRYSEEYEWYLRDTRTDDRARKIVEQLFGTGPNVEAFGQTWPNPVTLVDRILKEHNVFQGLAGPVHGDLHPKNIVFDDQKEANIIDFGWARNDTHVVVDYLLLDINLRAITMASQVPDIELLGAAHFLHNGDVCKGVNDPRLVKRLGIIKEVIWSLAVSNNAVSADTGPAWLKEYMIPYFLVAFGLLIYLDDAQNQRALLASVLAAAKRIDCELPVST